MTPSESDAAQLKMFAWHNVRQGSDAVDLALKQIATGMARFQGDEYESLRESLRYAYKALQATQGMMARIKRADPASNFQKTVIEAGVK